jgi:hypothetical protein
MFQVKAIITVADIKHSYQQNVACQMLLSKLMLTNEKL